MINARSTLQNISIISKVRISEISLWSFCMYLNIFPCAWIKLKNSIDICTTCRVFKLFDVFQTCLTYSSHILYSHVSNSMSQKVFHILYPKYVSNVFHSSCRISINSDSINIISVQFSHSVVSNSLWSHGLQHTRPPCLSPLLEFTQAHVHWVGDAIQPSHHLAVSYLFAFSYCSWGSQGKNTVIFQCGNFNHVIQQIIISTIGMWAWALFYIPAYLLFYFFN